MTFDEAITASGLNAALQQVGKALITEDAAKLHIQIAKLEGIAPEIISFTHECEYSFQPTNLLPNVNGHAESVWKWDIGGWGMNLGWCLRSIFQGEYSSHGLLFVDVFGSKFYADDGETPIAFNGSLVANGQLAARQLLFLSKKFGNVRTGTIAFTGPDHQIRRAELYDATIDRFAKFFQLYVG